MSVFSLPIVDPIKKKSVVGGGAVFTFGSGYGAKRKRRIMMTFFSRRSKSCIFTSNWQFEAGNLNHKLHWRDSHLLSER